MKETINFLASLKRNNNREWFEAHRHLYLHARAAVDSLADRLIRAVASVEPRAGTLSVKDCTYRIYRDTRFSSDKTPYKTHMGIFINPGGKKSPFGGWYFHIEPDNCFAAAGNVCIAPAYVKAIRQSIYDNVEEYEEIVEDATLRNLYPTLGENPVKTAPKGFPRDWPHIDYLRPRDFIISGKLDESLLTGIAPGEALMPWIEAALPYLRFINFAVEEEMDGVSPGPFIP